MAQETTGPGEEPTGADYRLPSEYLFIISDWYCSQPWLETLLASVSSECRDALQFKVQKTSSCWDAQITDNTKAQEKQQNWGRKSIRTRAVKCCSLDITWSLQPRTHNHCDYLHRMKPAKNSNMDWGEAPKVPPLAEEP